MSLPYTDNITVLNAVTDSTTSSPFDISKRQSIAVQFIGSGNIGPSGSGTFFIDASNDGTNWISSIAFRDATATTSTTWVTSKQVTSSTTNGTLGGYVESGWRYIRVRVNVNTSGTYTAIIQAAG